MKPESCTLKSIYVFILILTSLGLASCSDSPAGFVRNDLEGAFPETS